MFFPRVAPGFHLKLGLGERGGLSSPAGRQALTQSTALALKSLIEPSAIAQFVAAVVPVGDSRLVEQIQSSVSRNPKARLSCDDLCEGITPVQPGTQKHWLGALSRATDIEAARVAAESARPARSGPAIEQAIRQELKTAGVEVTDSSILAQVQSTLRHTEEINAFTRHFATTSDRRADIVMGAFNGVPVGTKTTWLDAERDLVSGWRASRS